MNLPQNKKKIYVIFAVWFRPNRYNADKVVKTADSAFGEIVGDCILGTEATGNLERALIARLGDKDARLCSGTGAGFNKFG